MHKNFYQGMLITLVLFCLIACASPTCRQWVLEDLTDIDPCFNSGRMVLYPESTICYLELELDRSRTGLRMYINILLFQAPPYPLDPNLAEVNILIEGEERMTIYPHVLNGGQRLLLPSDISAYFIKLLLADCSFKIQIGRQETEIVPTNFKNLYKKILNIPIAEEEIIN